MNWKRRGLILMVAVYATAAGLVGWRAFHEHLSDKVTISISHFQLEGTVRDGIADVIRRYEQINPRVHVVQLVVPGSIYVEWMRAQLAGGTAPDIMEYTYAWGHIDELALRYFQPLSLEVARPNPYDRGTPMEGVPWRDTFIDRMNAGDGYISSLGDYYAPAVATFTFRVFYNRVLLRAITGRDQPPRTWPDFLALCAAVRAYARGHRLHLYPVANSRPNCQYVASPVMTGMAGRLFSRIDHLHSLKISYGEIADSLRHGEWSYFSPEVADGLEVFREIGNNSQPGFVEATTDAATLYFLRGEALMFCSGSWDASSLRQQAGFDVGAFRLPLPDRQDPRYGADIQGPASDGQVTTGSPFYLNQACFHRAEAIDFLRFLTSVEGNQIFVDASQWLPSVRCVRPTEFSRQFLPFYEGYCWDPESYLFGGTGVDMLETFMNEMNLLFGPNGSVRAMQDAMQRLLPEATHRDLQIRLASTRDDFNSQDLAFAERHRNRPGDPGLLAAPAMREAHYYQILELEGGLRTSAAGGPATPEAPADPSLGGGPARDRLNCLDQALGLLTVQPVTETHVDRARSLFASLAASGTDEPALAARYFLGRIAEFFQRPADPDEAARQFRLLIATKPGSFWAQSAITRLAVLEVYALDQARTPAARIAAAENLVVGAEPNAATGVHLVLEDAIFHYQLPVAAALPHLLAADKLGCLDDQTHADVLVQIAEVSALLGNRAQARSYYEKLLAEYPMDQRHYMIREKLTALALTRSR